MCKLKHSYNQIKSTMEIQINQKYMYASPRQKTNSVPQLILSDYDCKSICTLGFNFLTFNDGLWKNKKISNGMCTLEMFSMCVDVSL